MNLNTTFKVSAFRQRNELREVGKTSTSMLVISIILEAAVAVIARILIDQNLASVNVRFSEHFAM
jgi:hypothetical protein